MADEQRKDRIISHMNKDHTRELVHLLRYFNKLSPSQAALPSLRDVSLESMSIRAGGLNHTVTFTPALSSWDEVRTRLVEMDSTARKALGISDVYITEYKPPTGIGIAFFGGVVFYIYSVVTLPWVQPGSQTWNLLSKISPQAPAAYIWLVRAILIPVIAIHVTEAVIFDRIRMQRHGVPRGSLVWWLWQGSVLIEGVTAFWRIDSMVEAKKNKMKAKKSS